MPLWASRSIKASGALGAGRGCRVCWGPSEGVGVSGVN